MSIVNEMPDERLNVLLLCDYRPQDAATMVDHINAFYYYSQHNFYVLPLLRYFGEIPEDLDLDQFDAVIFHYSLTLAIDAYLSPRSRGRLSRFPGLKALFIQDEYRFVDRTISAIQEISFDLLFTCVPEGEIEKVYPTAKLPNLVKVNVLTGYVPFWLTLLPTRPLAKRRIDIGYRGRKYPHWHGQLGLEKWEIADRVSKDSRSHGLRVNISTREEDRLYGAKWPEFLTRCKAVLGVESGCSVFDFQHRIGPACEAHAALLHKRGRETVTFEEARALFFGEQQDRISLNQISPRCFEAIAARTMLILYEGEYSGILKPWRHYVPLAKDHSNFSEVVDVLRDERRTAEIIATAFAEIACNDEYSYKSFVKRVDALLSRAVIGKPQGYVAPRKDGFEKQYGFEYIPNPHQFDAQKYRMVSSIGSVARRFMPGWARAAVKMLIRRGYR